MRIRYCYALALALTLFLGACDALQEPDRYFDANAHPPTVTTLDVLDLRPGQHVAGNIRLTLDLDSLAGRVQRVVLHVGDEVWSREELPYAFDLHTWRYAEGEYPIAVAVYERNASLGLAGALGFPSIVFESTLVFDQSPPTPVEITSITWEGGRPRITWEESGDANFFAYLVATPEYNGTPYVPALDGYVVDTLYDRASPSFLGEPAAEVFGWEGYYRIAVSNRAELAASEWHTVRYGDPLDLNINASPLASPTRPEFYAHASLDPEAAHMDLIVAFSPETHEVTRSVTIEERFGPRANLFSLKLSVDGERLYAHVESYDGSDYVRSLVAVDAASFSELGRFEIPPTMGAAVPGMGDRLYVVTDGAFRVLDGGTGAEIDRLTGFAPQTTGVEAVSLDGRVAYVYEYRHADEQALYAIDVGSGAPSVLAELVLPRDAQASRHLRPLEDGRVVYHDRQGRLSVRDGASLATVATVPLSGNPYDYDVRSLYADGDDLFVAVQPFTGQAHGPGTLMWFDLRDGAEIHRWDFRNAPYHVTGDATGGSIYATSYTGSRAQVWLIDLSDYDDAP